MGYALTEWVFTQVDHSETTGGSPPVTDDDSGVLFAMTVDTADSPTIYTDVNGTTLTEVNGVARMQFSNGHIRFWTGTDVTALDVSWIGAKGCGFLRNVGPGQHMLANQGIGGPMLTAIPLQGLGANTASAEVTLSIVPASGTMLTKAWGVVTSAGGAASNAFDLGIEASATNGDANGILDAVSAASIGLFEGMGVLSMFRFDGSNDIISVTPSKSHVGGMVAYLHLNYGNTY